MHTVESTVKPKRAVIGVYDKKLGPREYYLVIEYEDGSAHSRSEFRRQETTVDGLAKMMVENLLVDDELDPAVYLDSSFLFNEGEAFWGSDYRRLDEEEFAFLRDRIEFYNREYWP
jgi:hypothetical protein